MRRKMTPPDPAAAREAAVLIVALICLLLATVLAASLARTALLQREQVIRDEWQLQAEWLAEAGVDRAAARRNAEPDYAGEEWMPELNDSGTPLGRVQITVAGQEAESGPALVRISVTADVPADSADRARVQRTTMFTPHTDEN